MFKQQGDNSNSLS